MKAFFKKYAITIITVFIAIIAIRLLWNYYMLSPWTRDARIRTDIVTVTSDVSGYISELLIKDNQEVKKGDILLKINDDRYRAEVQRAKAQVEMKKEYLRLKIHEAERRISLDTHAISSELKENAKIEVDIAKADLLVAEAALKQAEIDLNRTIIYAPKSGVISNLHLVEGNYVKTGESVVAIIVKDSYYIQAYLEETKLAQVKVGMPVKIRLMNGNIKFTGVVESISAGITDQSTTTDNQLLANVTPTYNWVRLAQRIPVRIKIDEIPKDIHLANGMTASVRIQE